MSGQSLFPDDYPPKQVVPKVKRTCCEDITDPPGDVDGFTWRMTHAFGHTRSTVGVNTLSELAGSTPKVAQAALVEAEEIGWLRRVVPEAYEKNPPALWLGRLSQRS